MKESIATFSELRRSLAKTIADRTKVDGVHETAVPSLLFCRQSICDVPTIRMYEPSIAVVVQGVKRSIVGDDVHDYDETQFLLTSIDLPTVTSVSRATPDEPCLGVMFKLNLHVVSRLLVDFKLPDVKAERPQNSISIGTLSPQLLATMKRLVDLLDHPEHSLVLLPMIEREILYWLLIGEHGARLRQLAMSGSKTNQIAKAADWIKANYVGTLCVSQLAKDVNMSISSFHHHFRVIMSMSPLQYQKQLRLHEARQLMLTDNVEAAAAALHVGYESHTQFSREYKRLFSAPPIRDIARLRQLCQPQAAEHSISAESPRRAGPIINGKRVQVPAGSRWGERSSDSSHLDVARFWNARYSEETLTEA